jgi:hypothetical protein
MAKTTPLYDDMVEVLQSNRKSQMTGVGPRDSDTELIIQLLQIHYNANLNAEQLATLRLINVESITRARRKLQSAGEYLPDSPEVAKKRRLKSYELQQVSPKETAAGLQRRIQENE